MTAPRDVTADRIDEAARIARTRLRCDCYYPDEVEFYGDEPCARCAILTALTDGQEPTAVNR